MARIRRSSLGFTLLELLIVIAILGLLATVALVNLNPGGNFIEARNAKRITDMAAIQSALELYSLRNGGIFPPATSALSSALTPFYIATIPVDPKEGESYRYCLSTTTRGYGIGIPLEDSAATGIAHIMKNSTILLNMPIGCGDATSFKRVDNNETLNTSCDNVNIYCLRGNRN